MSRSRVPPAPWGIGLCALLALTPAPVTAAQWQIGLAAHFADTRTNAIGLGGTIDWRHRPWFHVRTFFDAERGVPDMKEGLQYEEPAREYIIDRDGVRQNPRGDELWQGQGWNVHLAGYAAFRVWKVSAGPGLAYNGHDGSASSGPSFMLTGHISSVSQLDIEFLGGGSWRLRFAIGFWHFP